MRSRLRKKEGTTVPIEAVAGPWSQAKLIGGNESDRKRVLELQQTYLDAMEQLAELASARHDNTIKI